MGKRSYGGAQKHMGRAEFQTKLICLSLRLKRGGRGDQGWSMGLEEERRRAKKKKTTKTVLKADAAAVFFPQHINK